MKNQIKSVLAVAIAASLAACGGGGSSSSVETPPVVNPPVVVPPTVTPSDLQTSVPALTYPQNSAEFTFVTAFNNFRAAAGLGLLAQNPALDKAAASHLKYVNEHASYYGGTVDMSALNTQHNTPNFHIEDSAKSGFTGVKALDRANFAGYGGTYVGESGSYGDAAESFAKLVATIYHRQGLMFQSPRDIGIAIGSDAFKTAVIETGYTMKGQSNASDYLGAYPADKQSLVPLFAGAETPNPYPDVVGGAAADVAKSTSYPVSISAKEFSSFEVTSFAITQDGQATPLKMRLFTNKSDSFVGSTFAFLVGYEPFKPSMKYNVSFTGKVNGQNVTKTWSFTTANSCPTFSTCK